jgi:hypothetical protein
MPLPSKYSDTSVLPLVITCIVDSFVNKARCSGYLHSRGIISRSTEYSACQVLPEYQEHQPRTQWRTGSYYLTPYLLVLLLSRLMPPRAGASRGHTHIVCCNSGRKSNKGAALDDQAIVDSVSLFACSCSDYRMRVEQVQRDRGRQEAEDYVLLLTC